MSSCGMHPEANPVIGVLEGGTDAASMLIFDPAALPDDYDPRARDDPMSIIERLSDDGELYWLYTASDGGYSLGVRIDDGPPADTAEFARPLGAAPRFNATGGRLCFTGIEYAFHHDDSFLRKYPHMGACCEIPAGTYRLTLYGMEYPEDFHEDLLRERLSPGGYRVYSLMNGLIPLGCIGTIALVVSPFLLGLRLWGTAALPLGLAAVLPPLLISRSRAYREARQRHSAIQREYPDFWAALEMVSDESPLSPPDQRAKSPSNK